MINLIKQALARLGRTKTKSLLLTCSILGALALPFLAPVQIVHAENPQNGNPYTLVGSWMEVITLDPNGIPPGVPPTFTSLETFTVGGGSVTSANGQGFHNPPAYGNWVRAGNRQFLSTFLQFNVDPAGNFAGLVKVRRTIKLSPSGDEFSGRDNVDLFDPAGNPIPVNIPPATFTGKRIAVEPVTR